MARDRTDPILRDLVKELEVVRQQLATLTFALPAPGTEAKRQEQWAEIARREQELSKAIGEATGTPGERDSWMELIAVRRALPADSVFIDIIRHGSTTSRRADKDGAPRRADYTALVIPPSGKGAVKVVDLGDAKRIDAAVTSVRTALSQASPRIRRDGDPNAEQGLREPLEALAKLILHPLSAHVKAKQRWIISPDGALWLVPWAALPLEDGLFAIERHTISYVLSGRDIVGGGRAVQATGPALVMAAPDYNMKPEGARAELRQGVASNAEDGSAGEFRSLRSGGLVETAEALPATKEEAEAILPAIEKYTGKKPDVRTGRQALEGVFKAARQPRLVVLSTHGFFLEDQEIAASEDLPAEKEKRPLLTKGGKLLENPLLRCGLLLAGCNKRAQAVEGDDDGVLTGLEIVGTDLRGTELVVLSACDTGVGVVRNGEGVAGLRQAFQLAGAKGVLSTLWPIPDDETVQLMSDFFGKLAEGKGKADALREAQLAMIKSLREAKGTAHPFYWAAFTLTGE